MSYRALEGSLREFMSGGARIGVLGIGNDLRSDDGVGLFIVSGLRIEHPDLLIENVGSVPEAFARPLAEFGAERVILIDAADMQRPPGHVELVTKEQIGGRGITISTHNMPLSFLMMYLEQETGGKTILLGIQPKSLEFGERLTAEICMVSQKIISVLEQALRQHLRGLKDVPNDRMA